MRSAILRWVPLILIAVAGAISAAVWSDVPSAVVLPVDGIIPFASGTPAEPAPRWVLLYSMPALAFALWAAFRAFPTSAGQRLARRMYRGAPEHVTSPDQFARFGKTYDTIVLGVVMLVLGLHAGALAVALGANEIAVHIAPVVLGASLVLMGNVFPRLKPNWVAGIRTKATLADPDLWRSTHRTFGAAFVGAGMVTIAVGLVAPRFGLIAGVGSLLAALLVGFVASRPNRAVPPAVMALLCVIVSDGGAQLPPVARIVELTPPAGVLESPYSFSREGFTLHGTLARSREAEGRTPIVVIVAGSGPTDRNANGPSVNTNAYAMLAWALAENGIATLRYDKRGIGQSGAPKGGDPSYLTLDTYVSDLLAAAQALADDPRFSKVILLGHSEGAGLSIQAANRGAPVSGVIMVSAQGRKFGDLVREQFARQTDSATAVLIDTAFARLLRGEDPGEVPPIARPLIIPAAANFLRSFVAYDPPAEVRRFPGPLLILQGQTDIQTTMDDARLLADAQPRATFVPLEGVNHVLKRIDSTVPRDQGATYQDPHMPLAPSVAATIVRWIVALR